MNATQTQSAVQSVVSSTATSTFVPFEGKLHRSLVSRSVQHELFSLHREFDSFSVVTARGTKLSAKALVELFEEDTKRECAIPFPVEAAHISPEPFNVPAYLQSISLSNIGKFRNGVDRKSSEAVGYHLYALNDAQEVCSYAEVGACVSFSNDPDGTADMEELTLAEVEAWFKDGKKDKLECSVTVYLDRVYTMTKHRNRGASATLMMVCAELIQDDLLRIHDWLSNGIDGTGKSVEFNILVSAELYSYSGSASLNALTGEFEAFADFLNSPDNNPSIETKVDWEGCY